MRIFQKDENFVAIADEGKKFLFADGTLFHLCIRPTEEALRELTEVPVINGEIISEEIFTRRKLLHELKEIREWFESTDYIPNKVIVGEWEEIDERFIAYKTERQIKRARQDEIKILLGYQQ